MLQRPWPKNKMGKDLEKSGVNLPVDISLDEWDPFHDLIIIISILALPLMGRRWMNSVGLDTLG